MPGFERQSNNSFQSPSVQIINIDMGIEKSKGDVEL